MCGFVAIRNFDDAPIDESVVRHMTRQMVHRGPDDEGILVERNIAFGFRRLAILDLSHSGYQPMTGDDGNLTIVFNGEIFNYIELRKELGARGHRFRSSGDTEVLLHAYAEWGADCLNRLNGMWAFLIFDRHRGVLFGSRDRFGIKPLFCMKDRQRSIFASEIKAILAAGGSSPEPNWSVAARFLVDDRLDDTHETFFHGIHQIPPGTAFELDREGQLRSWKFWSLRQRPDLVDEPAEAFAALFDDSVRLRLRSDVPVGVSLSGGLDSTSIICSATRQRRHGEEPMLAFWFNSETFDETEYVQATVRQTAAELRPLEISARDLWEDLPEVLRFHDEPLHSMTALVGYQIMKLARQNGVKVILSGQGADETLAGYPSYFPCYWQSLLRAGRLRKLQQELEAHCGTRGGSRNRLAAEQLAKFIRSGLSRLPGYGRLAMARRRRSLQRPGWYTPEFKALVAAGPHERIDQRLRPQLCRSVERDPLPLYLRLEDRNSMAHSIEARVPFLDYRLVELAFSLPDDWRMRGPWNKFILREAMRGRIPENVRTRVEKFGFPVPVNDWMRGPLLDDLADLVASRDMRERGIYDIARLRGDLREFRDGKLHVGAELFKLAQMEIWFSTCVYARKRQAAAH